MADDTIYRQIVHGLSIALVAADRDLNIRAWNPAASRLLGAAAEQVIGTPLVNTIPAEGRPVMQRLFQRAIKDRESSEFETSLRDTQGDRRFLAVTISPIVTETGECIGACAAVRDITRRVKLEKQVATHRTMAALGNLSGSIAHHFNNLLGGIATSVDYAQSTPNPTATRRALQQTAELVARAAKITESLLTFSENDPQIEPPIPFDEVVRKFVTENREAIEARGIRLVVDLEPIPPVPVPALRTRTVLQNLTANAVEATPTGGEVRIRLAQADQEVRLLVEDTGPGISPEARIHIFEPFFTTKGTLAGGQADHIGLGLAVVHGIVRGLDGTVCVSSADGGGTTFEIRLPIPQEPNAS
jgi:PAS domain S-box-containing protein